MSHIESAPGGDKINRPSLAEQVDVLLALALSNKSAAGDCPSMEHIVAWHEHRLTGLHKAKIESHVARCQHCYGLWSGLLDAVAVDSEASSPGRRGPQLSRSWPWIGRCSGWRAGLVSGGLITAGIVFFVSLVLGPERSQWPHFESIEQGFLTVAGAGLATAVDEKWIWDSGLGVKSLDMVGRNNTEVSWEQRVAQRAFGYGVRVGLQRMVGADGFWRGAVQALPSNQESCSESTEVDECKSINRTFYELGRWGVLVHFACDVSTSFGYSSKTAGQLPPEFWTQQVDLMMELDRLVQSALSDSSFARFFTEWRHEAEDPMSPRMALCSREAALLTLGLQ